MGEKLVLCFILVFLQGSIEDRLEVGGGRCGSGSGGREMSLGHRSNSQKEGERREIVCYGWAQGVSASKRLSGRRAIFGSRPIATTIVKLKYWNPREECQCVA